MKKLSIGLLVFLVVGCASLPEIKEVMTIEQRVHYYNSQVDVYSELLHKIESQGGIGSYANRDIIRKRLLNAKQDLKASYDELEFGYLDSTIPTEVTFESDKHIAFYKKRVAHYAQLLRNLEKEGGISRMTYEQIIRDKLLQSRVDLTYHYNIKINEIKLLVFKAD